MVRHPNASPVAPFGYFDEDNCVPGRDYALTETIFLPHRRLYHELSEDCWCEPKYVYSEEIDDFHLIHNDILQ